MKFYTRLVVGTVVVLLATVLVLSGVTREGDAGIAETAPDLVVASIRDLVR